jgi:putative transposase
MWNSSIRPEDIRVPEDPALLDVVMGRRFARVLTHKGIEFQGLFYNSPELHELRCRNGSELQVEIRVDESDLGRIFVLSPKPREVYAVPALRSDYAAGIGLFQHRVIRQYQKRHAPLKPNADGWLQAKEEIVKIIENETHLKRKRSHQRVARWGDSKLAASLGDSLPPTKTLPARAAPEEARACVLTEAIQDRALKTKDLPVTIQER